MAARSTSSWVSAPATAGMNPNAATSIRATLRAMPSQMLLRATRMVRRPISTASATLAMSSATSTTSADSLAAVEPRAPMAMPTSAAARTGASLTPSPTMITGRGSIAATAFTLSSGSSPARTSVMPRPSATAAAVPWPSPVSMTVRRMPSPARRCRVAAAFSRTASLMISVPAKRPSMPT